MSWKSWIPCFGICCISCNECSSTRPRSLASSSSFPRRLSFNDISELSPPLSPKDLSSMLVGSNLQVFTFKEMKAVTKNFLSTNILGSGGFGTVYKGYIDEKLRPDLQAQRVAVKSLDLEGKQGHKEWLAEVIILGQLRHPNIVKLIGYCCEDEHRMLVYEYMPRGSLEKNLFKGFLASLPWSTRMKIAVGTAKGLNFLHEAEQPVIYRDFKASNILLDLDSTAKLSDFGLAKDGPEGDVTHITTRVMGTHGYACPEYVLTGHLTAKSDVYSFGVVLLELLSGRRSVEKKRPEREKNLVEWARPLLTSPSRLIRVMDCNLESQYPLSCATKAAAVAYKCLSKNPKSRPTMRAVVEVLEHLLEFYDVPLGSILYIAPDERCSADQKEIEVEYKDGNENQMEEKDRNERPMNHDERHKKRYPSSAIHSEVSLHRDGSRLYNKSLKYRQLSQKENKDSEP